MINLIDFINFRSKLNLQRIFIFAFFLNITLSSQAEVNQSADKIKTKSQSPNNYIGSSFESSGKLSYDGGTDILDKEPRTIGHSLGLGLKIKFNNHAVGFRSGVFFESERNQIIDNERDSMLSDTILSYSFSSYLLGRYKFSHSLANQFPTSDTSQFEGYKSILGYSMSYEHSFSNFSIVPGVFMRRFLNTYDKSPSSFKYNPAWSYGFGINFGLMFSKTLNLEVGGNIRTNERIDGERTYRGSNAVGLGYEYKKVSTKLIYANGESTDNGGNLWLDTRSPLLFDEYQQTVTWSLSWGF